MNSTDAPDEKRIPDDTEAIHLSSIDQSRLVDMLLNPPTPNHALLRAINRHRTMFEPEPGDSDE
ncbi:MULTISPECIES: type II toxin -antitoxin system TacA 1-like antitoxin [Burkholderia]|uniref:type II toxin -antitoxin system TacA 1-like antitoxin n=1 Tax=Burkholderia TaxID=32008 RepID=UPI0009E6A0FF|nr:MULTISPECIES: DUF1778 domain-containing protein [Burkholderia]